MLFVRTGLTGHLLGKNQASYMPYDAHTASVDDAFFLPLGGLAAGSPHALACRDLHDDVFIRLGIQWVL